MLIQKEKRNRLIRLFAFVMLLGATQTWAIMAGGGAQAEQEVVITIKGWLWVFAFMPFAVAKGLVVALKNYLEQKDEQSNGQTEPKFQRYAKLIGAFVGGVIAMYIVYGLWGMVFMGESFFSVTWNKTAIFKREEDKEFHFLIKYFDRYKNKTFSRIEFATLMELESKFKYKSDSENLFKRANLELNYDDKLCMLEYYFYSFIIKHNDMHIKNISVISNVQTSVLAPLYDICCTGIYDGFTQESILPINGKQNNIKFDNFKILFQIANVKESDFVEKAKRILTLYIDKMPNYIEKLKTLDLPFYDVRYKPNLRQIQFYDAMKTIMKYA